MGHELLTNADGSVSFVSARLDAWHRLGTVFHRTLTAEEALEIAKLSGWRVQKNPIYTRVLTSNGFVEVEVPDNFVTVRTDPVTGDQVVVGAKARKAGVVGTIHDPFQNEQLCAFLNTLVDESGAHIETAGALRDGADVFVTAKLPEDILVGGVDPVNLNIALLNNHTGVGSIRGIITPTRVVCANTQRMAESNAVASFKIKHTKTASARVEEARKALGLSWRYAEVFQAEAEAMIQQALTDAKFDEIVGQLWTPPEQDAPSRSITLDKVRSDELHRLFTDAETNANIRGTAWAGYQAVAEYVDHFQPTRGRGLDAEAARATRAATGGSDKIKDKAFALFGKV